MIRYSCVLLFLVSSLLLRAQKTGIGGNFLMPTHWSNDNRNRILADLTNYSGMELHLKVEAKFWQFFSLVSGVNDGKLNRNDAKSEIVCQKYTHPGFFSAIIKFGGFFQLNPYPSVLKNFISVLPLFMQLSLSSLYFIPKMNLNFETIAIQPLRTEGCGVEGFGPGDDLWSEKGGSTGSLKVEIVEKCTNIAETKQMMSDTCYVNSYEVGLLSAMLLDRTPEIRNTDELLHGENGVKRVGPEKELYSMSGISFLTHYQARQEEQESVVLLKFSVSNLNKYYYI